MSAEMISHDLRSPVGTLNSSCVVVARVYAATSSTPVAPSVAMATWLQASEQNRIDPAYETLRMLLSLKTSGTPCPHSRDIIADVALTEDIRGTSPDMIAMQARPLHLLQLPIDMQADSARCLPPPTPSRVSSSCSTRALHSPHDLLLTHRALWQTLDVDVSACCRRFARRVPATAIR